MRKSKHGVFDVIYIHLNEKERFVLSYGIEFIEFYRVLSSTLHSVLLLKHEYEDSEFHSHTRLDYVPKHKLPKLAKDDVYSYGDFSWIDFDEIDSLDVLQGQTIAELLYLGHIKDHLRAPFYQQLNNRFVYLAHDDGWFNKTYYKDINDFYHLLGEVIASKLESIKLERLFLGIKKRKDYPAISKQATLMLKTLMKEGMVLSIQKATQNRMRIEVPIWVLGDFSNMDSMYEEYEKKSKQSSDAKLIFDKRTREWQVSVL